MGKIIFKIVEHYPESKRILIRFARKHSDKPIDEYPKFITSYDKNSIDLFDTESFITSLVSSSGVRRINKMEKQQEVLRENIPDEIDLSKELNIDNLVGKVIEGNTEKFSGYSKLKMREVKL